MSEEQNPAIEMSIAINSVTDEDIREVEQVLDDLTNMDDYCFGLLGKFGKRLHTLIHKKINQSNLLVRHIQNMHSFSVHLDNIDEDARKMESEYRKVIEEIRYLCALFVFFCSRQSLQLSQLLIEDPNAIVRVGKGWKFYAYSDDRPEDDDGDYAPPADETSVTYH